MLRLSRTRWALIFAAIFFVAFEALAIYVFVMNRRLTHELVSHSWRQPTTLLSAAGSNRTIATLYGVGWPITSPLSLHSLPDYVSTAFVAAQAVRCRAHRGL